MNNNFNVEDIKLFQRIFNLISIEDVSIRLMRWWRGIFLISVFIVIILLDNGDTKKSTITLWLFSYFVYFTLNEVFRNSSLTNYNHYFARIIRIHLDLVFIAILLYIEPNLIFHWFWVYLTMPLLASVFYFNDVRLMFFIFTEVAIIIFGLTFKLFGFSFQNVVTIIAKWASLGLFVNVLYFILKLVPRLSYAENLSNTASQLIGAMSSSEIVQLLSDTARKGIHSAESAVVHLLGGENNNTLIASGSSSIDITALGRSPMDVGHGIAGFVIQSLRAENIHNTKKDNRFAPVPQELGNISSLLVAPIYIGKKKIGTISVNSSQIKAFDDRDLQFLETLAAQAAMALANAELLEIRSRGRKQIADILAASLDFDPKSSLDMITKEIANIVCRYSEYNIAVVNLIDTQDGQLNIMATAGIPPHGVSRLHGKRVPVEVISPLLVDKFRISQSYFIKHDRIGNIKELDDIAYTPSLGYRKPGEWDQEDMLIVPIYGHNARLIGYISVDDPVDKQLPTYDTVQVLEVLARVAGTAIENTLLFSQLEDQAEETSRTARMLHLLARISATTEITTNVERFLHILLTAITSGEGLRFNRACIFGVDRKNKDLIGLIGIGQLNNIDARSRWEQMVNQGLTIEDYLIGMQAGSDIEWTEVHDKIKGLRIPIVFEDPDAFCIVVSNIQLTLINSASVFKLPEAYVEIMEPITPTVIVPLVSQKRIVGLLVCDNKFTDDKVETNLELLQYFAAHIAAGMENYRLISEAKELIVTTAVQAERERLQDDLHEALGMLTTGVKWEAEIIQEELELKDIKNANIATTRLLSVFATAYQSLNGILEDLRDPTLEIEGLVPALKKRAGMIRDESIKIEDLLKRRLSPNSESLLYRVGLEGISNALKYSGIKSDRNVKIFVKIQEEPNDKVSLTVYDTGAGFNVNAALQNLNKYGLRRIQDKLTYVGGELIIYSSLGKGTEFKAIIPSNWS